MPAKNDHHFERLLRYVARPPLPKGRVERLVDGRVVYHLKRPRRGVTQFIFEISAFIARLAALIPRPGSHQIRYFGAYSNGSSIRDLI